MAKSRNIRTTLEHLLKKVEQLENQGFAQKLAIDELESKLQQAEETIKKIQDNPFGFTTTAVPYVPFVTPAVPLVHVCQASIPDMFGNTYCTTCGCLMYSVTYTTPVVTGTTTLLPITQQSSLDVESISEEIDISCLPNDSSKQE